MYQTASLIIPTYNRKKSLIRLLDKLSSQTYPVELWDVIVVDDGSTENYQEPELFNQYTFKICYVRQENQGAVAARNLGARKSQADILIFLDDDVLIDPAYVAYIVKEHNIYDRAIIMGSFNLIFTGQDSNFRATVVKYGVTQDSIPDNKFISFIHCVSHNLSIKRHHFYEIGLFQDPTQGKGWPNWDDIDLAYRAHLANFIFLRIPDATGTHVDSSLNDFHVYCKRIFKAGRSARFLFNKYPEVEHLLPMFIDKTAIDLKNDSKRLIVRKLFRVFLAWGPILWLMENGVSFLIHFSPDSRLIIKELYRWINSSYIYKGFHSRD